MTDRGILVHEWLAKSGGSENVFAAMAKAFPEADLLSLWDDLPARFSGRPMQQTWLSRTPLRKSKSMALPFMPWTWRNRPGQYDWALISSHLFAHHVSFKDSRDMQKFAYVHSPARYLWDPALDVRGRHIAVRALAPALKNLDRARASELRGIAANSEFVRERIARAWRRGASVIYPPVDVAAIQATQDWTANLQQSELETVRQLPTEYLLGASRMVPYKQLDRVIAAGELIGMPVVLAGDGPELAKLKSQAEGAKVPVTIVRAPSTRLLYALYQRAQVYVFPPIEDFGIMPVEAMATGTPVVTCDRGGATESVISGVSGHHSNFDDARQLGSALLSAIALDRREVAISARRFSVSRFEAEIQEFVRRSVNK